MKRMNTLVGFWAGLLLSAISLSGQVADNFSNISYLTSDHGLSQGEVTCILQDQRGFLWIGTRGGLNRYDGYQFTVFKNEIANPNSLINNSIESLYEDRSGKIWVGTKSGGVSCYDPDRESFTHFRADGEADNTISGNRVISIGESPTGDIWFGTWSNGISIYDPETEDFTHLLPGRQVGDILPGRDGRMWVANQQRLECFDSTGVALGSFSYPGSTGNYEALLEDPDRNCLWIGSWQSGLLRFDLTTRSFRQYRYAARGSAFDRANNSYALFRDAQQQIWMGTWGGGLFIFDPEAEQFTRRELAAGPNRDMKELYNEILCVFQDRSGIIWIGTNGGGLCKINRNVNPFGLLKGSSDPAAALPSANSIWSVLEDDRGTLWVGTKGDYFLSYAEDSLSFRTLEFPELRQNPNLNNRLAGARTLFQKRDKSLWVGTHHGLYQILRDDRGRYRLERIYAAGTPTIRGYKIISMAETTDGSFWIGTQQNGLNRIRPATGSAPAQVDHYAAGKAPRALKNQRISAMLEDRAQRFWVGTYGGLHLYLPEADGFRAFTKWPGDLESLSSDIIICLYEDRQQRLWIGTPNGLNLAIPGPGNDWRFRSFQEKDGLPNNYIHAIREDQEGNLWISTNKGISKFDPAASVFYNYDVNDGLQGNSFSEGVAGTGRDGKLYFGGIYGLNFFHPDSIINDPVPPPVFISGFRIFNQEVRVGERVGDRVILEQSLGNTKRITLTHRENVFSLEFTALDFRAPHKNIYRYRLRGLEEEWNEAGNRRNVTYTNLRPSTYTFEVDAANNHQVWNDNAASLEIQILPPFWATWQAYLLYALVLIGLFGLYHRITTRQSQLKRKLELTRLERKKDAEVTELKTRFFTNITHELRSPLTLITGPVEELLDDGSIQGKAKRYLFSVHQHSQRLLALVNQLLDFRKAESGNMVLEAARGDFVAFAREVFLSFQSLAEKKNIDFRFTSEPEEIPLYFDRNKMEIVLCNLLSNAFKYTPEGRRIELSIRTGQCEARAPASPADCCEIGIEDNGIGMPQELVDKIFNRFYQIANTESVKMVGTGIGLALVESIVHLHAGQVEVAAERGQGSRFTVHLPLGAEHLSADQILPHFRNSDDVSHYVPTALEPEAPTINPPVSAEAATPQPSSATLLVVEDNPQIRSFIVSVFPASYRVLEAENGKEGWEIARREKPDLIISDVMMPEMDGINFCRKLKKNEQTSHIPLIILTARTSNVFKVEGFHSGADAYLTKPFQPSVLKAQVASILETRRQLREYFSRQVTLQPSDVEITSEDEQFLKQAIQVIEDNLDNDALGKVFLAQAMAMSPSSLYRRVKSSTDLTVNAFIRSIRLRRAAQLLRNTQYHVSEIGYRVGFNDLKYFRKCFRKQFGQNPSEYADTASLPAASDK